MSAAFISFIPPHARSDKQPPPAVPFQPVGSSVTGQTTAVHPIVQGPKEADSASEKHLSIPVPKPACVPSVTLKREQDRITWITIQCSCGEVIELNCQY